MAEVWDREPLLKAHGLELLLALTKNHNTTVKPLISASPLLPNFCKSIKIDQVMGANIECELRENSTLQVFLEIKCAKIVFSIGL